MPAERKYAPAYGWFFLLQLFLLISNFIVCCKAFQSDIQKTSTISMALNLAYTVFLLLNSMHLYKANFKVGANDVDKTKKVFLKQEMLWLMGLEVFILTVAVTLANKLPTASEAKFSLWIGGLCSNVILLSVPVLALRDQCWKKEIKLSEAMGFSNLRAGVDWTSMLFENTTVALNYSFRAMFFASLLNLIALSSMISQYYIIAIAATIANAVCSFFMLGMAWSAYVTACNTDNAPSSQRLLL